MTGHFCFIKNFRCTAAIIVAIAGLSTTQLCSADTFSLPHADAFYHQFLKLPDDHGYLPTRSFTIIVDTEHGNQLVAEDDPNLRFNKLWMDQLKPGYQSAQGGSALGELFRSYLKTAYKAYRDYNGQAMSALPDENGSIHAKRDATSLFDAMDYNVKMTSDEVRFKIQYNY